MTAEFQYIYILGVGTVPSSSGGGPRRPRRGVPETAWTAAMSARTALESVRADGRCGPHPASYNPCRNRSSTCGAPQRVWRGRIQSGQKWWSSGHARCTAHTWPASLRPEARRLVDRPSALLSESTRPAAGARTSLRSAGGGSDRPGLDVADDTAGPARSAALTARPPSAGGHPPAVSRIDG